MPVFNNVLAGAAGSAGGADAGFKIERGLRFNKHNSAHLSRSVSSSSNRRTWTWSCWIKRCSLGDRQEIFSAGNDGTDFFFETDNKLQFYYYQPGVGYQGWCKTDGVFRDVSAWYHIVLVVDTTQSTEGDRVKIYVNGVRQALTFTNNFDENDQADINLNTTHYIGRYSGGSSLYANYYLAEVHFVDGQALAATDFGEVNTETGVWDPKEFSGNHGTNGFHLDFSDNSSDSALGNDAAGNNNFTVNNLTASAGLEVTVGAATGALPVLNTTGDQGATTNSPKTARSDSNSSYLELAAPLDTSTWEEYSGNSRTISNNSVTSSTSRYRFYGASAYFNGSADLTIENVNNIFDFGTSDFTIEIWVRPASTSGDQYIISWECSGPDAGHAGFNIYQGNWRLGAFNNDLTGGNTGLAAGEWVHLAMARQGTTLRTFINGVLTDSHSNSDNFSATTDLTLGRYAGGSMLRFTGYMQDLRVYKGVAKYTSTFNPPTFANATAAAETDSLLDSPSNYDATSGNNGGNYATWSPLAAQTSGSITLKDGNLNTVCGSTRTSCMSTFPLTGKTYWEVVFGAGANNSFGMTEATGFNTVANDNSGLKYVGYKDYSYGWQQTEGRLYNASNNLSSSPGTYSNGDVVGWAYDADNRTLKLYKNGTLQHTQTNIADAQYFPALTHSDNNATASVNFGQRPFAHPVSGYKSLCTQNIADPDIDNPATAFDVILYDGDGNSTQTISGLSFNPDFIWNKNRNTGHHHRLFDAVRGFTKFLASDDTGADNFVTDYGYITGTSDTGFTVGQGTHSGNLINVNDNPYINWCWDAGTSNTTVATNANGTGLPGADCVYRANTTAGFSIVRVASPTSTETRVHGLNKKPDLIICKSTDSSDSWHTYHSSLGYQKYINLNQTNGASSSDQFGSQEPTSTYFYVKSNTGSGANKSDGMIYYIWHAVEGYSAFGSYTAKDHPHSIYTGFRPELVICKRTDTSGEGWLMTSAPTQVNNSFGLYIGAHSSSAEATSGNYMDLVANGFVHRHNSGWNNATGGGQYIYMAWAENPFKYARAR